MLVRYVTQKRYEEAVGHPLPAAKFLDIILYSREQIIEESASMGQPEPTYTQEWAVISVKPQVGAVVVVAVFLISVCGIAVVVVVVVIMVVVVVVVGFTACGLCCVCSRM